MTVVKHSSEERVVLDFSDSTLSKNQIKKSLRLLKITTKQNDAYVINKIKVGMYYVLLFPPPLDYPKSLKEFSGDMFIQISEDKYNTPISLKNDGRFKGQYWVTKHTTVYVHLDKIKTLVDIIKHCHRLDKLKAFI